MVFAIYLDATPENHTDLNGPIPNLVLLTYFCPILAIESRTFSKVTNPGLSKLLVIFVPFVVAFFLPTILQKYYF